MKRILVMGIRIPVLSVFMLMCMALVAPSVHGQTEVTGNVSDATGPLPGVNVVVKGTTVGVSTDFDGNYSIEVPQGQGTLVFTYIGYQKQEVAINDRTTVDVVMTEDAQSLSEVVVVGYGTQRKADLTGSVGSIGSSEIVTKPITSPDQALAGTISGVNITNRSGDPGAPISVNIRGVGTPGVNDPLWVIDGVPIVQTTNITVNTSSTTDSNPLAGLNANDIESIDVLKDAASTAIYGARAANGVIIVTTKRGKRGDARVTYDGYTSFATVRKTIDVLDVEQYIDIQGQLGTDLSQFSGQSFVDWQDLMFKTGFVQNHNVSVSGGNEKATYFISGGYMDQEGVERAQGFRRYSFKANSDIQVGERLKFGESILISQVDRQVQSEPGIFAGFNSATNAPYYQPYGDGPLGYNLINQQTVGQGSATNYLFNTDDRFTKTTIQTRKVLANFYGELNIVEGLKARTSLGIDYNVGVGDYFTSGIDLLNGASGSSLLVSERPIELTLTSAATLQYDKTFGDGDHNIGALFGFEQTKFRYDKQRLQGRDLFNENFAATGTTVAGANEADLWTLQGWLGRLTYNYKGRYLATANVRRDATSRFAPGNRDQVFPSVSVGWRITDESFFPEDTKIDDIKLRAGWGQSGNQFTGLNFAYLSAIDNNVRYVIGDDQQTVVAPAPTTFANSDLKWETSTQFDIGVDASFYDGKLTTTIDYYNKTTDDVLIGFPLPYVSGFFLSADANIGQIKNSGIEFSFNYANSVGDFKYSFGGNLTTVKNEVTDLGSIPSIISGIGGASTHRTIVGESLGHFYGYRTNGLYQNDAEVAAAVPDALGTPSPGDIRFVDVNNDGVVDAEDRTILGSPFPGFFYGFAFNAEYKGFDLSMNLRGVGDRQIFNSARIGLEGMTGQGNFSTQILDRWTGEGTTNSSSNPRLAVNDPNGNNRFSDRWVENAGYLRIQNISVGYTVPQEKLKNWTDNFITNMRFYIGAQNLATFTEYSGYDPEVGRDQSFQKGDFTLATGQDGGQSPLPRIIQLGWTVNFN
ncbi:TonB-dependent receptor [Flagellimonas halotolerans]|uniref:TonB-dependent receptor n=1 Tax=Flagellimonas halotolerans TaxID=3112164 RepID=A0ABU6ITB6_9FLAO|nr:MULTISPECIES: TonB-dependent receptor [unclassified Allomuricauda]MEC3966209.1 TonB-dependent receptor [Muricauda sp. SYSU M86414]MEC4266105.1 TonB-dependent receptor [Muricauda sp. SYSU M84420]